MKRRYPVEIPVIEPMHPRRANVYEHTPIDYYGRGEYPRILRPVDANRTRTRTVYVWAESFDGAARIAAKLTGNGDGVALSLRK